MKAGISGRVGSSRQWVVSGYYATGINDYDRLSQYRNNVGVGVTRYPLMHR
jgi:hypothetical protein